MAVVVTDENVARTPWPRAVEEALAAGAVEIVGRSVLEPGEAAKRPSAVERLWAEWTRAGAGRETLVVAVGGGVVTDVAGFAAATHLRGVEWAAVPTTVLGMADAAVGGKTGVNTPEGKNLAGAIHHPVAVLADPDCVSTLPDDVHADGWAEVVKAGVIGDASLLEALEREADAVRGRRLDVVEGLLAASVAVKADVVAADDRERGRREILNFGHTVAHALEHVTRHAVSHGRAVAVGMVAEARVASRLGRLDPESPARIADVCAALRIPSSLPPGIRPAEIVAATAVDKKRRRGVLRLALPVALGRHDDEPGVEVDESELEAALGA
jgi:3-dehydroquinate synthase